MNTYVKKMREALGAFYEKAVDHENNVNKANQRYKADVAAMKSRGLTNSLRRKSGRLLTLSQRQKTRESKRPDGGARWMVIRSTTAI